MKEAMYFKGEGSLIHCTLCPHHCHIKEGKTGRCGVRKVIDGKLYSLNYGQVSAISVDPIEKKPLVQWMPGSEVLSFGTFGCNLHCDFCQNYRISLERPTTLHMTPEDIVQRALNLKVPSIAYTYNEPTVFYEMMWDTARLAKENQLHNVVVTNGHIERQPLMDILPYVDAMNIDLKTYRDDIYSKLGGSTVEAILQTIKEASSKCHVEISLLIVPGVSDDLVQMEDLFKRLHHISSDFVLHISRYYPMYKCKEEPTALDVLMKIRDLGLECFDKIYLGNVW